MSPGESEHVRSFGLPGGAALVVTRIPDGLVVVEHSETGDRLVMEEEEMRRRVRERRESE